jgi:uncharacterized protein involved in response to NO
VDARGTYAFLLSFLMPMGSWRSADDDDFAMLGALSASTVTSTSHHYHSFINSDVHSSTMISRVTLLVAALLSASCSAFAPSLGKFKLDPKKLVNHNICDSENLGDTQDVFSLV